MEALCNLQELGEATKETVHRNENCV